MIVAGILVAGGWVAVIIFVMCLLAIAKDDPYTSITQERRK